MKTRKHINEIFLESLAQWLRANNRSADADLLDGVDPLTFTRSTSYSGSPVTYGTAANPNKGNGGNITINKLQYTFNVMKMTGVSLNKTPSILEFINLCPPELRVKYIGNFGSSSTTAVDLKTFGLDTSRPGCRCFAQMGANSYAFIVLVGSDEDPNDPAIIEKYLPFTFGFVKGDIWAGGAYGSVSYFRKTSNIFNGTFCALGWRATKPAEATKPINQDLPVVKYQQPSNKAPDGYTTVPAFTVTADWETLRNKYNSKVHFNRPFLDVIENALRTAGNTAVADQIKSVNPETFAPFQVTTNTANKTVTITGARCSTSKLYFAGITFNIYQYNTTLTNMYIAHMSWMYTAASGLQWNILTNQTTANAYKGTDVVAEDQFRYFFKHLPTGTPLTTELFKQHMPFDMTGVNYAYPVYLPAAKTGNANFYNELLENLWTGASSLNMTLVSDL